MCEEMIKLRGMLCGADIDWHDESDPLIDKSKIFPVSVDTRIYRTHFSVNKTNFSVINGFGTYGGLSFFDFKNKGLLELMINNEDPIGFLTASEVMKIVKERIEDGKR